MPSRAPMSRLAAAVVVAFWATAPLYGTVLVTVEEALGQLFPEASIERETLFLTDDQISNIEALAGRPPAGALVTRFVARVDGAIVGWAYLDTHRVRTLPETVMIAVGPDAQVLRVEVVTFREPLDYLPPDRWYEQYDGRLLDDELELKRGIRPITGATLTARATTDAVRRALAVHRVVAGAGEAE